jgi:hypothetical protein
MPPPQRAPDCEDWNDWRTQPDSHLPFQYWQWDGNNPAGSEQLLGERLYTTSCLLWTALHDRHIGEQLKARNPNWSAVASYYSMVHALRLLWFILYGSYPTGHSAMSHALAGRRGVKPNWGREEGVPPGESAITRSALQGAIRDGLGEADLAERLPSIGGIFGAAIRLREDSNYESLILAHQYSHGSASQDFVNVQEEFTRATDSMLSANHTVLRFTVDVLLAAFKPDRQWFCPTVAYPASDLLQLVVAYVGAKIRSCYDEWDEPEVSRSNWAGSFGPMAGLLDTASFHASGEAGKLLRFARFSTFEMKRGVMREFRVKINDLVNALRPPRQRESQLPFAAPHQNDE